ncbi:MAG TPA: plastocyanin/azurin family copper-binding protein [Myxococcaceae bacterium]|jgi:plastocyanin|nr:plastocyanin/azurin family copper-binding protein [Myxococcaceae bacterium]
MRFSPVTIPLICICLALAAACSSDSSGNLCADRSADSADRTVAFGGFQGSGAFSYSPSCMIIAAGQTVSFQGDFTMHPLSRGTVNDVNAGSPNSPLPLPANDVGSSLAVTFPASGDYPYWCTIHTREGMNGAIQVK